MSCSTVAAAMPGLTSHCAFSLLEENEVRGESEASYWWATKRRIAACPPTLMFATVYGGSFFFVQSLITQVVRSVGSGTPISNLIMKVIGGTASKTARLVLFGGTACLLQGVLSDLLLPPPEKKSLFDPFGAHPPEILQKGFGIGALAGVAGTYPALVRLPFTRTVTAGLYVLGGLAGALLYPQFTVMGQIMLDAKAKSKGELPFEEWPVIAPAKLGERLDPTAYYKRFGMRPHLVSQEARSGALDYLHPKELSLYHAIVKAADNLNVPIKARMDPFLAASAAWTVGLIETESVLRKMGKEPTPITMEFARHFREMVKVAQNDCFVSADDQAVEAIREHVRATHAQKETMPRE